MKKVLAGAVVVTLCFWSLVIFSVFGSTQKALADAENDCTAPGTGTASVDVSGPARLPVVGAYTVTSNYGMRTNPGGIYKGRFMLHAGIDIAETGGEGPVVAAMGGTVRKVFIDSIGTKIVNVDVGGGVVMGYYHLSKFAAGLKAGSKVWPGKQLGTEGATGNVSGPHLHFQVEVNGTPTEPRAWMAKHGVKIPQVGSGGTGAPPVTTAPAATSSSSSAAAVAATASTSSGGSITTGNPVSGSLPKTVGAYSGVQVTNAAYIIKAGQAMGLDSWTVTVGVMTAMGESTLRVLNRGDAAGPDSRGLFQQRGNGAWGSLSDRMNPTISSTNFFKALQRVGGYRQMTPTHAAHAAQANADPEYYSPFWSAAVQMVSTLTNDPGLLKSLPVYGPVSGDTSACTGSSDGSPGGSTGTGTGAQIVAAARKYLGTPYSWGGGGYDGPSLGIASGGLDGSHIVGFDCSGLVMYAVYQTTGIKLPHSADDQAFSTKGTPVARDFNAMQPGDVIAFSENGTGDRGSFGHVAIYLGGGRAIDAPSPGKDVHEFDLKNSSYYKPMKWSIRRFTKTTTAQPSSSQATTSPTRGVQ